MSNHETQSKSLKIIKKSNQAGYLEKFSNIYN